MIMNYAARGSGLALILIVGCAPASSGDNGLIQPTIPSPEGEPGVRDDASVIVSHGGDGGAPRRTDGGVTPPRPDGGAPLPSADGGRNEPDAAPPRKKLTFSFTVEGAVDPIHAYTESADSTDIVIVNFPSVIQWTISYGVLPVGYQGAFSSAFCADIRTKANVVKANGIGALTYKRIIRRDADVPLTIGLLPFVGGEFLEAATKAAIAAGNHNNGFSIVNSVSLTEADLTISFAPDALSQVIGATQPIIDAARTYFQANTNPFAPVFGLPINAKDVLCDFSTGKASIVIQLKGDVDGTPYAGVLTATGMKAL